MEIHFSSHWGFDAIVQFSSVTQSCLTLCDPMDCSTPGIPVYHQLPEIIQTHVYWVSDTIQSSHPLSSSSPPAFNLSQHQGLSKWGGHLCIRWPKNWSFSFNISPSNEHPGLLSLRMDWLDLLAVQGTSRVFPNTIVQKHQFFSVQVFLYSNSTTGKTIALTRWTFVCKVMSLVFNMLSRLVITFLPRSKHLLISWL